MKKMTDSAQVRMNVALVGALGTQLDQIRKFDLTQASTPALRTGAQALDERGIWRVRLEDPRTDDEEKHDLIVTELRRREALGYPV